MNHVGSSVNLHIVKDGKILVLRRISNKWMDGRLQIPGGHTEPGESPQEAVLREAREELGIEIGPTDVKLVSTVAVCDGDHEYFALQFALLHPENHQYTIMEIEKCSELVWADISNLPEDTIDIFKDIIASTYAEHQPYLELGYEQ